MLFSLSSLAATSVYFSLFSSHSSTVSRLFFFFQFTKNSNKVISDSIPGIACHVWNSLKKKKLLLLVRALLNHLHKISERKREHMFTTHPNTWQQRQDQKVILIHRQVTRSRVSEASYRDLCWPADLLGFLTLFPYQNHRPVQQIPSQQPFDILPDKIVLPLPNSSFLLDTGGSHQILKSVSVSMCV